MKRLNGHQGYYEGNCGRYDAYKDIDWWEYNDIDYDAIHRIRVNRDIIESHNHWTCEDIEWGWVESIPGGIDYDRFGPGDSGFFAFGQIGDADVDFIGRRMHDGGIMIWHADEPENSGLTLRDEAFILSAGLNRSILQEQEKRFERNYGKRRYRRIMSDIRHDIGNLTAEEVYDIIYSTYSQPGWSESGNYQLPVNSPEFEAFIQQEESKFKEEEDKETLGFLETSIDFLQETFSNARDMLAYIAEIRSNRMHF